MSLSQAVINRRKDLAKIFSSHYEQRIYALLDSDEFSEKYTLSDNAMKLLEDTNQFAKLLTFRIGVVVLKELSEKKIIVIKENGDVESNLEKQEKVLNSIFDTCLQKAINSLEK